MHGVDCKAAIDTVSKPIVILQTHIRYNFSFILLYYHSNSPDACFKEWIEKVGMMALCRTAHKPLSETLMAYFDEAYLRRSASMV